MNDRDLETDQRTPPRTDRSGFLYRLSIYFVGIAIGFMILGMFRAKSAAEAKRREAERAAALGEVPAPATPPAPAANP